MVVEDNDGVVKDPPVPNKVPPVDASYQSMVAPVLGDAVIVTVPAPHLEAFPAVAVGILFIAATTAVLAEMQPVVVLRACA